MRLIHILFCWFGCHEWTMDRAFTSDEMIGQPAWKGGDTPIRTCQHCGKRQRWSPGAAGTYTDGKAWLAFGKWRSAP